MRKPVQGPKCGHTAQREKDEEATKSDHRVRNLSEQSRACRHRDQSNCDYNDILYEETVLCHRLGHAVLLLWARMPHNLRSHLPKFIRKRGWFMPIAWMG